ncbi:Hypp6790 [Branchiostoma lanceolatum]|uniref:Hypp6790 protein n=1 Tax=Branchiostoma lanceolatum TaxID=7740 RepID=A0A8J9YVE9_BRALA|nr:Hypp6790 [Branchiostoma lanceolatum]
MMIHVIGYTHFRHLAGTIAIMAEAASLNDFNRWPKIRQKAFLKARGLPVTRPIDELQCRSTSMACRMLAMEDAPSQPMRRVYDAVIQGEERVEDAPNFRTVRTQLERRRASLAPLPTMEDVVIPDEWARTLGGRQYLSHQDNGRGILVFGTNRNFRKLRHCPPAHQREGEGGNLSPEMIVSDFEVSIISSNETEFPDAISGCYFHFCQSLWRRIQQLGLAGPYSSLYKVNDFVVVRGNANDGDDTVPWFAKVVAVNQSKRRLTLRWHVPNEEGVYTREIKGGKDLKDDSARFDDIVSTVQMSKDMKLPVEEFEKAWEALKQATERKKRDEAGGEAAVTASTSTSLDSDGDESDAEDGRLEVEKEKSEKERLLETAYTMDRHYKLLKAELGYTRQNIEVVQQLLDLEFPARKQFAAGISQHEARATKVLQRYSCFGDPLHLQDELRRYVAPDDKDFLRRLKEKLPQEAEALIHLGIDKALH